ncbi:hypothetical protein BCU68_08570 [Vibrio sp. 10N.286.49.B3]|uniref:tetratricopeptide repeat protein n=1 Tax=Vibrio sp. 10N.286.49.B3 TaxID=1880855 RepID=UPI000C865500|nr:hypothetical protein [Vibrio sp. 10N.286.49.B3]PMH46117.1 hypothetical protein BCU68_08570 [Vibrio sp. 10N.286.49.B3]
MIKRSLLILLTGLLSTTTLAAELSQYTAVRVQKAHQLQQEDNIAGAIDLLSKLESNRAYDNAYIARMLGVFYWQTGDIKSAIKQLTVAVKSGLLKDDQAWQTERMLADVLLTDQQFKKAIPHYYQLAKSIPETQQGDELWLRITQSHYQIQEWQSVLSALKQYDQFGNPDELQPLSLKIGAELQLKQWQAAIKTVERLLILQPEEVNWWRQLVSLQLQLNRTHSALDSLALAKLQGVELSNQDLRLLAQLYAQRGIPERAALVLEAIDGSESDIDLIVDQAANWQNAKEWSKATQLWQKAAKQKPKYHWQVGQLLLQEGHYQQAIDVFDRVPGKDKQVDVALAKVRAFYKLEQLEPALIEAKKANNLKESREAKSWIKYLSQLRTMNRNKEG